MTVRERIDKIVTDNKVVLFMKGNASFPQCGFSARAVAILQDLSVPFETVDVLEDDEIRQGIKEYGNWPTIPQLYVNKQLIGGSDIMMEMYQDGELQELFKKQCDDMNQTSSIEINKKVIETFYSAFQKRDGDTMASLYAPTATFEDPVFKLEGTRIGAMWKMLCLNGKDLKLQYSNVSATENSGKAQWVAEYTFSATGRKVINSISASFEFKDGKITKHKDDFSFWKWSAQALGFLGALLGWTTVVRAKVQNTAAQNLERFIAQNTK